MSARALPYVLTTSRLVLRPFEFGDVDDITAYAADEEWGRYLSNTPQPYRREDAVQFVARQALTDRAVHPTWAIVHDSTAVGGINIRFYYEYVVAEMGWSIHRRLWNRGLATEAARAVVDLAFGAHAELRRIGARADTRNVASHRVMEKLGMRKEGTLRQARVARGECIDEVHYGLLRPEWEGGRRRGYDTP
jgi:RimJ/RimL family protein N-acetyltransferase